MNYNPTSKNLLTIANVMTNDGTKNVRIILDIITNIFYTFDDDGNLVPINGGENTYLTGAEIVNNSLILTNSNGSQIVVPNINPQTIINNYITNNCNDCSSGSTPTPQYIPTLVRHNAQTRIAQHVYQNGEVWAEVYIGNNRSENYLVSLNAKHDYGDINSII
jgi:hypothetical protein